MITGNPHVAIFFPWCAPAVHIKIISNGMSDLFFRIQYLAHLIDLFHILVEVGSTTCTVAVDASLVVLECITGCINHDIAKEYGELTVMSTLFYL